MRSGAQGRRRAHVDTRYIVGFHDVVVFFLSCEHESALFISLPTFWFPDCRLRCLLGIYVGRSLAQSLSGLVNMWSWQRFFVFVMCYMVLFQNRVPALRGSLINRRSTTSFSAAALISTLIVFFFVHRKQSF